MSRAPGRDDVEPVVHEARDRLITALVTALPVLALGFVAWQLWDEALRWSDVIVFVVLYLSFGLGVTVRVSPAADAPQFRDDPLDAVSVWGARVGGDRGAGDRVGGRSSQASRLLGP
jgi:hypothetical protein